MGTLSLVFGIIVILIGMAFLAGAVFDYSVKGFLEEDYNEMRPVFTFGIAIIILAGGSALIIKYDNDKKKEKNS